MIRILVRNDTNPRAVTKVNNPYRTACATRLKRKASVERGSALLGGVWMRTARRTPANKILRASADRIIACAEIHMKKS